MTQQARRTDEEGLLGLIAIGLLVAAVAGAFLLDHVPWLLPWAVIAIILGLIAAVIAIVHGRVSHRVALVIAAVAVMIAAVTWAGGYGPGLNRDTRRQLRGRPAAQVAAYQRTHTHHPARHHRARRHPTGHHPQAGHRSHHPRQQHATPAQPSASARFYGAGQLGRWHWQRIITGWSLLLGAPLALLGIAAGLGATRWRRRGPPASPRPPSAGAGRLRTAGRR